MIARHGVARHDPKPLTRIWRTCATRPCPRSKGWRGIAARTAWRASDEQVLVTVITLWESIDAISLRIDSEPSRAVNDALGNTRQQCRREQPFTRSQLEDLDRLVRRERRRRNQRRHHLVAPWHRHRGNRAIDRGVFLAPGHDAADANEAPAGERPAALRARCGSLRDRCDAPRRARAPTASRRCRRRAPARPPAARSGRRRARRSPDARSRR